jgi:hypothetical protein
MAFVVLLLIGAAVSLPTGGRPGLEVANFYAAHRLAVLGTQAVGAIAALVFFVYASGLGGYAVRAATPRTWTGVRVAGLLVAAATLLTLVPPVTLALVARAGRAGGWIGRWHRAYALTDALLFLAIAFWCFMVTVETRRMPSWLRGFAAIVAVVSLVRAGAGVVAATSALDVLAPVAFAAVVLLTSGWLIVRAKPEAVVET